MLLAREEEEQWGFSTAEAAALAIDEVAQLRRRLVSWDSMGHCSWVEMVEGSFIESA